MEEIPHSFTWQFTASLAVTMASIPTGIGIFIYLFVVLFRQSVEAYDFKIRVFTGVMLAAHLTCLGITLAERADWMRHRRVAKGQIQTSNFGKQTELDPLVGIQYSFAAENGATYSSGAKLDAAYMARHQTAAGESNFTAGNSIDVYYDARRPGRYSLLEYPNDGTWRMLTAHSIFGLLFGTFFIGYFFYARYVRALPPYVPTYD